MNKKIIFFISFLILNICISNISAQNLTPKQFVEDLEFLKKELPKKHINLFAKMSENEFYNKITEIEQKSDSLNNENFEVELYKIFKEIGDEHTKIEPVYKTFYPLDFDFFKEGIFVTSADSAHYNLIYKKLEGIESTETKDIIKNFRDIINSDNESYFNVYFQHLINNPRILKGLNIVHSDSDANFILDNEKYLISPATEENFSTKSKLLIHSNSDYYWYKLIDNGKILYFNYQKCSEQNGKPFEVFSDELFSFIKDKKPQKIIIDLRNNSGGDSSILNPFLDKLKKNYLNKKDSSYVFIGRNTFSSALMNAVNLKINYRSILIGESTSANVNHYGETDGFRLPNSKIIVGYSTKYWENWKGYQGALKPDVEIEYSIKNFKNNIDEAVDYIVNFR